MHESNKGGARYVRQKRYGAANQLKYEATEKHERDSMRERMASIKREEKARAAQAQRRQIGRSQRGMNAGTVGRSRF